MLSSPPSAGGIVVFILLISALFAGAGRSAWSAEPTTTVTAGSGLPQPVVSVGSSAAVGVGPEVSKSAGPNGGVVVLWPRVIPATTDPQIRLYASFLQQTLRISAERAFPGLTVEVRPEPERVCPRSGCEALSIGALLTHDRGGCAVVGNIGTPGPVQTRLFTFSGTLAPLPAAIPFREPVERYVTIYDFDRCVDMPDQLAGRLLELENTLRALGSLPAP